ncbi:CHAD domain-containing protein [Alkalibacterium sp. f15]|uniref:CHAD domain-containing protein n=1 Tax=Alkalibacterium sp. f15 TaxID=3414029 RepID=UPI003BF90765
MSIELLLIRHGRAEDRASNKEDAERQLTKKGKKEFTDFITSIKAEIKTDKDLKVWTSPLKRAKQTATILTEQLEWKEAEEKEFIANGDFIALMDEISQLEPETLVVCVGHEPTLGIWIEELTGSDYSFKKGGLALVRLDENDQTKGTLIWDEDPKSKKKMAKKVEPVKDVLLRQAEAMEQSYENFRNNPYSPKLTHRFRVDMRKMRSLLHFVKPLIGEEPYEESTKLIQDALYRLEPLIEADVLIESCGERALLEPDLIDDYADLLRYLHNERRRSMRSRLNKSMIAAFEDMIVETKETINQLKFDEEKTDSRDLDAYLEKRLDSRKKKVLKSFKQVDHSDHEALNEVSKQAENLRFAANGYKEILPSKKVKKVKKKSKTIQTELGQICDLHAKSLWLKDCSEKAKKEPLKKAFSTLAERQMTLREDVISDSSRLDES